MHFDELFSKKTYAILGYGKEGQSTYRFLRQHGIHDGQITILDANTTIQPPENVHTILGNEYLHHLDQFDCIIKTPGITKTMIETETGRSLDGYPLTSQTEILLNNFDGKIIGITGTKGKTTISTLTYLTLKDAGKNVVLAGNIGTPILDSIDRDNLPAYIVYELSSFMIEAIFTSRTGRNLDIAIFNTLYTTHTKEHGGYHNYITAKTRIFKHATHALIGTQAYEVIHTDLPHALPSTNRSLYGQQGTYTRDGTYFFKDTTPLFSDQNMLLIGKHNRENTCAVIGICDLLDIDLTHLVATLQTFGGVEHRLELVGTYHDIVRYNDAIATTPQATGAALDSFGDQIDTLFYGGIEGEYDHALVAEKIRTYGIHHLVLFPDTGATLYDLLDDQTKNNVTVFHTRSMEEAVQRAAIHTNPKKIALLSCGSPSFSVWSGFIEKGTRFKEAVHLLKKKSEK